LLDSILKVSGEHEEKEEELDAEDKLENEAATEISTQIRRVLDGIRTYPPGHVTLKNYRAGLLDKLTAQLNQEEEYSLRVTPMGFATETRIVNKAEKLTDSITHPLYLDGVQLFTIKRGVTLLELEQLTDMWRATLDGRLGDTHTFTTRFWEANFPHLHVLSVESFSERSSTGEGNQPASALQAVVDELSGVAPKTRLAPLAGSSGFAGGRKLVRVTKEDLALLRSQGVSEMTEKELERYDSNERARIPGLKAGELATIAGEVRAEHAKAIERALDAVFATGLNATTDEQQKLRSAFALVLSAMLGANQIERLRQNLARQVQMARAGDPLELDARFSVVTMLMGAIGAAHIIEPTVAALDHDATREAATVILRFLPASTAAGLLDWLVVPQTPAGRRVFADLIAAMKPDVANLAARIGWSDETLAIELLHMAKALGGAQSWPVREAALAHAAVGVQREGLKDLDREALLTHKLKLLPLLASPVPELRHALFNAFVASKDKAVAPALATLLRRVQLDSAEHKRVLLALGTLGGPEACGALRNELTNGKDVELQCLAAYALGNAGDERSRPQLEELANKLFGGGQLKQAAKNALKQLDRMKAGKPA
jgi:hypothetical protein